MFENPRVAIIGGNGVIGTVLKNGLKNCILTSFGREDVDARDYKKLVNTLYGYDIVINLAFNPNSEKEDYKHLEYDPDNSLIAFNVYKASLKANVKRVIMASSVHADRFMDLIDRGGKISVNKIPSPDSAYGADKLFMEFLGKYFAKKNLEIICIRFGGVNANNIQPDDTVEHSVWLSNEDCVSVVNCCINVEIVPDNFSVFYAVSNNLGSVHDTTNPFGWIPN